MKGPKKTKSAIALGTPSTIMVFVTLCLACFAALAFATANAELRLCERTVEHTKAYYRADLAAQQTLMQLDMALKENPASTAKELSDLTNDASLSDYESEGSVLIGFDKPISEYNVLRVIIKRTPENHSSRYELLQYAVTLVNEPVYDEGFLDLWSGE